MPRPLDLSTNDKDFLQALLHDTGSRYDGRQFDQLRSVDLSFGDSLGHVYLTLGNTKLVVRISAEVGKPYEDRPLEGIFIITTDIGAMASPQFENQRQSDDEILLTRLIEKSIRRSNALDLESLVISAGKACWIIRADVHYLNFDGGFVDSTCLAVIAGLLHFKRPDTSIVGDSYVVHSVDERAPVPLSILHIPISVTFSFFKPPQKTTTSTAKKEQEEDQDMGDEYQTALNTISGADIVLVDTTAREEALRDGDMTITINKNRELCQVSKSGGNAVEGFMLISCANKAYEIATQLTDLIQARLKEDQLKRSSPDVTSALQAENDR